MGWLRKSGWTGLAVLSCAAARGGDESAPPLAARLARWFSPGLQGAETRLGEVMAELEKLPALQSQPFASRYGFRSELLSRQDEPHWFQLDLGRSRLIDRIAAVPVNVPVIGAGGGGYGFPLRFKIEISEDPAMRDAVTVVDCTGKDVANPGRYPLDFRIGPVRGRHVRFTSTRHYPVEDGFIWALEELVVLEGNLMAGAGARLEPNQASSSLELFPNWSVHRVNDGQSALGMPVDNETSPTKGYVSATTKDPQEEKWLSLDLGRVEPIDEVRLLPVESPGFETLGHRSYPRAWTVELATDPGFTEVVWRYRMPITNLVGYPGRCALVIPCEGKRGRYLRLVSQALWGTGDRCGFGLAEIQAYSGGRNVALGKRVSAKDEDATPGDAGWSADFVVDGFSSRSRLIEWPPYLDLIGRRNLLEQERDALIARIDGTVQRSGQVLAFGGATLGAAALLGWGWVVLRQRKLRQKAVAQLRDQIARDLHDDIGSNLGGIVLLSEMGSRYSADQAAREDFAAIKVAAEETLKSMQDMVWLVGRGNMGLRALVIRMRQSAAQLLGDMEVELAVDPAEFADRELSLLFRRHVFFAFKETLNNVRRHAGATGVGIRITTDGRHFSFEVRDNGAGFDPASAGASGHGLANLKRRAERLKGSFQLKSRPGEGTRVAFRAPLKS